MSSLIVKTYITFDANNSSMDENDIYKHGFNNPDSAGMLYSRAKRALVSDIATQQKSRTRERCEFWLRDEYERSYEEPIDFPLEEDDFYVREVPEVEPFTEEEYKVVNQIRNADCSSCNGTGHYCSDCNGTGTINCRGCRGGYKRKRCSNCSGNGKVEVVDTDLNKRNIQCGDCDGSGKQKSVHSRCGGQGELDCKTCLNGARDIECVDCDGHGRVTRIDATRVRFRVKTNSSEKKPSSINNAESHIVRNPRESHWNLKQQETYDKIPDAENGPDENLLLPIPDEEKLTIRYTKEEISYDKVDLTLSTSDLVGDYEDDTIKHTVWVREDGRWYNKISVNKQGMFSYLAEVLGSWFVVGLWGGAILSLIFLLPVSAFSDYVYEIPGLVIALIGTVVWAIINIFVLWDLVVTARYRFVN